LYFLKLKITTTINNKLKTNYNIIFITNINIPYKYLNHITKTPNKMKLEKEGEEKKFLTSGLGCLFRRGRILHCMYLLPFLPIFFFQLGLQNRQSFLNLFSDYLLNGWWWLVGLNYGVLIVKTLLPSLISLVVVIDIP
jgi:hypothetical protein